MLIVRGAIKDYDWGVVDGLAPWSGSTGGPQAELWFGVHPGGPSPLLGEDGELTGENLGDHFDIEAIPLLVKLLAAAKPLSVQLHPQGPLAASGWAEQQRNPAQRVYSDPFEKTEMMVALEPFEAFVGWRPLVQVRAMLATIDGLDAAVAAIDAGDRRGAIPLLIEACTPDRVAALPQAARAAGLPVSQVSAYGTVVEHYGQDAGALVTALLNYVRLEPGQAVYVPAGLPHSYIRGMGLEVMTSSDNVIRLGLTSKPVFVDHALRALVDDLHPQFLPTEHGDLIWPVSSPFVVRMVSQGEERIPQGAYRIVLLISGTASIETEAAETSLRPGTAAVLSADDPDARVHVQGLVAVIQSTER